MVNSTQRAGSKPVRKSAGKTRGLKPPPQTVSLRAMRKQRDQGLLPVRRSTRVRHERISRKEQDRIELLLRRHDPGIDALDPGEVRDDDDDDYLQSVPGRPNQFSTTWNAVYGKRVPCSTGYCISCEEGCGNDLFLDARLKEIRANSPTLKPRRPPVCHIVPWAALEYMLIQLEGREGNSRKFTDHFRQSVCWEVSNLRPGHHACNSAGLKVMAQNMRESDKRAALAVIERVRNAYLFPVWQ